MRSCNKRDADPARNLTEFFLSTREDNLLAQRAEHLHGEGLVAHCEIQPALIAKGCSYHSLFIQRRDEATIFGFRRAGLRRIDPMLEHLERQRHVVAAKLVRVCNADPQMRIGAHNFGETLIDRVHCAIWAGGAERTRV